MKQERFLFGKVIALMLCVVGTIRGIISFFLSPSPTPIQMGMMLILAGIAVFQFIDHFD